MAADAVGRAARPERGQRRARRRRGRRPGTMIDIAERDVDVPLSPLGERQSDALGRWFAALPRRAAPTVVLCSPYLRARQTAERVHAAIVAAGGARPAVEMTLDERLREKEFGILDRLTTHGIRAQVSRPGRAARARRQVLFPPARRRELVRRDPAPAQRARDADARAPPASACSIVAHQVIVNCLRYLLERLDEAADPGDRPRRPTCRTAASPRTSSIRRPAGTASWCCAWSTSSRRSSEAGAPVTRRARRAGGRQAVTRPALAPMRIDARLLRALAAAAAPTGRRRQGRARPRAGGRRQPRDAGRRPARRRSPRCAPAPASCGRDGASVAAGARARAARGARDRAAPRPRPAASPATAWRSSSRCSRRSTPSLIGPGMQDERRDARLRRAAARRAAPRRALRARRAGDVRAGADVAPLRARRRCSRRTPARWRT